LRAIGFGAIFCDMRPKPKKPKTSEKAPVMPRIWGSVPQDVEPLIRRSQARTGETESAWVRRAAIMRLEAEGLLPAP
jgi:hypothetical protein